MKMLNTAMALSLLAISLTACGSDTKETTVVHDRPVVVQQPSAAAPSVETTCTHGYDNMSHSCY